LELRVEDQLRRPAPPLIGLAGKTFFTEENLQAAFPGTMNTDAGIDFTATKSCSSDIVHPQVHRPHPRERSTNRINKDIENFFLHNAEQLDVTAANLLSDPRPPNSPLLRRPAKTADLPVRNPGRQFPLTKPCYLPPQPHRGRTANRGAPAYRSGHPHTHPLLESWKSLSCAVAVRIAGC